MAEEVLGKADTGQLGFEPMMAMIAIKVDKVSETASGLVLPDNAQAEYKTPKATVLAVGPEVKYTKVGDRVFIDAQTMARKLHLGGYDFVMIREDQLYGIDRGVDNSPIVREASQAKFLPKMSRN